MSAVAFDSLEYAHQLEAAGMPREQAEVVAKGLTTMFIHNFGSLVTRDYLDTRFTEFETRIEAKMDRRFADFRVEVLGETRRASQCVEAALLDVEYPDCGYTVAPGAKLARLENLHGDLFDENDDWWSGRNCLAYFRA